MFKVFTTNAVVSKGYDGAPALNFSENGNAVRFRIGKKVYDPKAENNQRWVNVTVKAFGGICERIKKMELKEGSFINFIGKLDEDAWTDKDGAAHSQMVIILDEIQYASGGGKSKSGQNGDQAQAAAPASAQNTGSAQTQEGMDNFTGFESPFGGSSFFG